MTKEPTNTEILTFLRDNVATKEDLRSLGERLDVRIDSVESRMATKEELHGVKFCMATKGDLKELNHSLKNFVSGRIADLEGAVITRQRRQDNKTNKLLDVIEEQELLPKEDIAGVREVLVFPAS